MLLLMLLSPLLLQLLHAAVTAAVAGAAAAIATSRPCHLLNLVAQGQITPLFGKMLWEGEPKSGSIPGILNPVTWTDCLGDDDSVCDVPTR